MTLHDPPTVQGFRDAAVRAFDFLRAEYGFRVAAAEFRALSPGFMGDPVSVDDAGSARLGQGVVTVRFESRDVAVVVGDDPRLETMCQLYRLAAPEGRVDLWHVRSFVGVGDRQLYEWGSATMGSVLPALADALARHGGPWLRGEPRAWQTLLRWWANGMPPSRPHV